MCENLFSYASALLCLYVVLYAVFITTKTTIVALEFESSAAIIFDYIFALIRLRVSREIPK